MRSAEREAACFFIGHRDAPETVFPALSRAVERHIAEYGVTEFVVGDRGAFDRMAARAVLEAKKRSPAVRLYLLIAYHPGERPAPLPAGFDMTFYPPGMERVPRRFAIARADRYMIDRSDYLIAYAWKPGGSALEHLRYARGRQARGLLRVTELSP